MRPSTTWPLIVLVILTLLNGLDMGTTTLLVPRCLQALPIEVCETNPLVQALYHWFPMADLLLLLYVPKAVAMTVFAAVLFSKWPVEAKAILLSPVGMVLVAAVANNLLLLLRL